MDWEYELLFDAAPTALENWSEQQTRARVGEMQYRTRTIQSGEIREVEVYPIWGREDQGRARAARGSSTPERIRRQNERNSLRRLIRLLNTNFTERDLHVTLTFAQAPDEAGEKRALQSFIRQVKRVRIRRGLPELKYIYALEEGESRRRHIHLVMSGGISREEMESWWRHGYANCDRLQPNEEGLKALGKYLIKEQNGPDRGKHMRRWSGSRNLEQPKVHISDTKLSTRRVEQLARDLPAIGAQILEKVNPGYTTNEVRVYFSDEITGVYIRSEMRSTRARADVGGRGNATNGTDGGRTRARAKKEGGGREARECRTT